MAEKSTVARPYAQAIFRHAQEHKRLAEWSELLALLAAIVADEAMAGLIGNPRVSREQLLSVIGDLCGERLDEYGERLLVVLADNDRLALLPEIARLYEGYRAEAEQIVHAEVVSAFPLTKEQQRRIAQALAARLGRKVELACRTDESLVGGAIVRAGDLVVDGSVTGHLQRLASALAH